MRRGAHGVCCALALVSLLAGTGLSQTEPPANPPPAPASQQAAQPTDEDAERKHLQQVQQEAAEKRRRAQILQGKENTMLKDLHATEGKLRKTRNTIHTLTVREKKLNGQLVVVRGDLDRSTQALESRREILAARLRGLYKLGSLHELGYLLSSESFAQLFIRTDYLIRIARQDRLLLLGIRHEKDRITANQTRLDRTLSDVEKNTRQKQVESRELDQLRQRKQVVVSSITSQRKDYEAAAAELEETARRIQALLAQLERQRQAEEEARKKGVPPGQQAPLAPYAGNFGGAQGSLPWPVRGDIVGHFGNETNPKFGTVTFNSGIDISAPMGTDVHAVAKGRVEVVNEDFGSYGEMIILNHGDGYYSLYAHLSAATVAKGQDVAAGQVIGRVGDTGSLQGSILHFEIRKGRTALNPTSWLK